MSTRHGSPVLRQSVFAIVFALGLMTIGATPCTAEPKAAPLAEALTGEAKAEYDAARLLVDDGDFAGAITKFRRSYELSHEPRLLWNVAVCEKELRHYASASLLVGRYLAEAGARLTPENRANAQETETALRGFYSEVTLTGAPEGARVSVDGVVVATAPLKEPLRLDLGTRKLRVEHPRFETRELVLEVPGKTALTEDVTLAPLVTTARLAVVVSPVEGIIRVDGRVVGNGRFQATLPAGEHRVEVTAAGRESYELHFELSPRQSRTLDVTLAAEKKAALWPWIVGGAAVLAGAGVTTFLLLRGGDEPGQPPHGQLGEVYLPVLRR